MDDVTVLIPIGPKVSNLRWIREALRSVFGQKHPVKEIMLIDDQAHLTSQWIWETFDIFDDDSFHFLGTDHRGKETWAWENRIPYISLWQTPWRLGFAGAFNCGVALSAHDLVMYLASDDLLYPDCVADCVEAYRRNQEQDAWYAVSYEVENSPGVREIPINAAMITKGLWQYTGGFPPSAFVGPDALILSCLMVHAPDKIVHVAPGKANYFNRVHAEQDTGEASFFLSEMDSIRNKETNRFQPYPEWANER